jgi:hypothetical protein
MTLWDRPCGMSRVKDSAALLSVVSSGKDTIIIFAGTRSSMPLQKKDEKESNDCSTLQKSTFSPARKFLSGDG